jgi:xanthine dehydrogenase small subunit
LCGNIANGSPIGDAPPALIAVGATLTIRKGAQIRHANLEDFFIEYSKQDLSPGEFVQAVDITAPDDPMDLRCYKISKRFDQDISAIMAAINIRLRSEKIVEVRIAFGGMAATPKRAKAAEAAVKGKPFAEAAFKAAMDALDQDFAPIDDHRASAAYRMKTAKNLILKYFVERNFGEARITGRGKVLAQDVVAG